MTAKQIPVTENLLRFCYHCEAAHECTTEEQCRACWEAAGIGKPLEEGAEEMQQLLQAYYA
ncbi:hypothetical protein EBB07_13275 [Paenibacillaceae bacterium]|nr:hypothetical protein EBB07_13275 [Paenibacillaceae bacterium]